MITSMAKNKNMAKCVKAVINISQIINSSICNAAIGFARIATKNICRSALMTVKP